MTAGKSQERLLIILTSNSYWTLLLFLFSFKLSSGDPRVMLCICTFLQVPSWSFKSEQKETSFHLVFSFFLGGGSGGIPNDLFKRFRNLCTIMVTNCPCRWWYWRHGTLKPETRQYVVWICREDMHCGLCCSWTDVVIQLNIQCISPVRAPSLFLPWGTFTVPSLSFHAVWQPGRS